MRKTLLLPVSIGVLALGTLCVYVFAQQTSSVDTTSGTTDTLATAITLIDVGDPEDALGVIADIPATDPQYAVGQCYQAVALFDLDDYQAFLKQIEQPEVQNAVIAPDLRQDLAFKEIEALFHFRRLDDVVAKAQAFQTQNAGSSQLGAVSEYQMAALFERGMKKLTDVSKTQDTNEITLHAKDAQLTLSNFLALASNCAGYGVLTNRALKEDVWRARIMLGDGAVALTQISKTNVADLEKFSLLRIRLSARLHPLDWDQNFALRTNFIATFPNSTSRKRIEFDTADVCFPIAKKLCVEADAADSAGYTQLASSKRASAQQYLQMQRSLLSGLVPDAQLGIEEWDLLELREDLLYGYYLQKDFATLTQSASSMVTNSPQGSAEWMLGTFFTGVVAFNQSPRDTATATSAFDSILAQGFRNKADHDHIVVSAAMWRVRLALNIGNIQKAREIVMWVQNSGCKKNIKADFLKQYAGMVGL